MFRTSHCNPNIHLGGVLAFGADSTVYEAHDGLVVKCIQSNNKGINCLMEASIMKTIMHPNLMNAVHIEAQVDALYIVMDRARCTLNNIPREEITPLVLQRWSLGLVRAVDCLHRQKILHADIKPCNILVFNNGDIKLADFSRSLLILEEDNVLQLKNDIGTLAYQAPEIHKSGKASLASDIWSLGCTLHEVANGEIFMQVNDVTYKKVLNRLKDWNKSVPNTPIVYLLRHMLQRYPSKRHTAHRLLTCNYLRQLHTDQPLEYEVRENRSTRKASPTTLEGAKNHLNSFDCSQATKEQSMYLYQKSAIYTNEALDLVRLQACCDIARKQTTDRTKEIDINDTCWRKNAERELCRALDFQLHAPHNIDLMK